MSITIFIPKDNGDLKYVAEVDEVERPEMALDALLDEMPRVANQSTVFAAVVGSMEDGRMVILELDPEAPVEERPKRAISVSASTNGMTADPDEDVAPAPRRRGRPKGSGTTRGRSTSTKRTATKKVDGRTKAGRAAKARAGGRSPFKARAEDD